jgi:hypothetical protein
LHLRVGPGGSKDDRGEDPVPIDRAVSTLDPRGHSPLLLKGLQQIRAVVYETLNLAQHRVAFGKKLHLATDYGAPMPVQMAKADCRELRGKGRALL